MKETIVSEVWMLLRLALLDLTLPQEVWEQSESVIFAQRDFTAQQLEMWVMEFLVPPETFVSEVNQQLLDL